MFGTELDLISVAGGVLIILAILLLAHQDRKTDELTITKEKMYENKSGKLHKGNDIRTEGLKMENLKLPPTILIKV